MQKIAYTDGNGELTSCSLFLAAWCPGSGSFLVLEVELFDDRLYRSHKNEIFSRVRRMPRRYKHARLSSVAIQALHHHRREPSHSEHGRRSRYRSPPRADSHLWTRF